MKDDERDELLIRLDQGFTDFRKHHDEKAEITEKRLNSHASDIKILKEWRGYVSGAVAVVAGAFGIHLKSGVH